MQGKSDNWEDNFTRGSKLILFKILSVFYFKSARLPAELMKLDNEKFNNLLQEEL